MRIYAGWKKVMQKKSVKKKGSSVTRIIPPKKNKTESLSRDEIRSLNKKRIRRKRKLKRLITLFFLTVGIAGVGLALVLSVFFKIETVQITGARVYSDKDILEKSNIEIGDNLFSVNEKNINKKLPEKLPYIESVTVKRKLPDTLIIDVTASKEIAAIENGTGFAVVNKNGKVLDTNVSMLKEGVAIISGVKVKTLESGKTIELKTPELTNALLTSLNSISNCELKLLTEISVTENGEIELGYDDRIKIELGATVNLDKKIERAKAALDKENEINPYSEGLLDLKTEPYAYFSAGSYKKLKNEDKNNNTDKNKTEKPETTQAVTEKTIN